MLGSGQRRGKKWRRGNTHPEEIINKLREAEVVIAAGSIVADAAQLPRGVRQDGGTLGRRGGDHPQDLLKLAELELIDLYQRSVWTGSPTTSWRGTASH